jgi:hypothetical protein
LYIQSRARAHRGEILQNHLAVQGSQSRLRARIKAMLGETQDTGVNSEQMAKVVLRFDEMLEIDPHDTRHMFWEEMKRVFYAMRDVRAEDLDQEIMADFLKAMDELSNILHRIEKRRRAREQPVKAGQFVV